MSSDLARGIFCSTITDQLTDSETQSQSMTIAICTSDAHCFRIGSLRRSREKLSNRRIRRHSLFNAAMCPCPWLAGFIQEGGLQIWEHSRVFETVFENIFENIFHCNIWQSWCSHGQQVRHHQRQRLTTFINYIAIDYSNTCQSTTFTK